MVKPRLAIIGSGHIAEFHVPALREVGFEVVAACSRPGSKRLQSFVQRHEIDRAFSSVEMLMDDHRNWDALLICSSIESTLDILIQALHLNVPVLVEKPVSEYSSKLAQFVGRDLPVIVGYNRRFYNTVREAKLEVERGTPLMAHLSLPESIRTPDNPGDDQHYYSKFFTNSVHGLDLTRYILGNLTIEHSQLRRNFTGGIIGLNATLMSDGGNSLQFTANWGAPANLGLTLDQQGRRFELRPFEAATIFEGMDVIQPNDENPIRRYVPRHVSSIGLSEMDLNFKPGFVAQSKALLALVRGENTGPAARLQDSYEVLRLAEDLIQGA